MKKMEKFEKCILESIDDLTSFIDYLKESNSPIRDIDFLLGERAGLELALIILKKSHYENI